MSHLEKQVNMYKERVNYHESIEEEHRKNLEQQVDVILKMEEERLTLLKEHKQSVEAFQVIAKEKAELEDAKASLTKDNQTIKSTLGECEATLKALKEELDQ